jgi:hypothetical protein
MSVEMWPIERPIPYGRNARVIPESAVAKVAGSIHEFGFRQPIVVDESGVIIAGHTRLLAAQRLGLERVPVVVAAGLTPAQVKAYRLADNRTGQEATWDMELLGIELEELSTLDIDLLLTGFEEDEVGRWLVGDAETPTLPDGESGVIAMTFVLSEAQAAMVRSAVSAAHDAGAHGDEENQNGNGAALAFICEDFVGRR